MDKPDNFYEVLGVSRDASDMDVAQAYRALVKKLQQALIPENEATTAQVIARLDLAYSTLLDPEQKKKHDEKIAWFIAQQRLAADKERQLVQRLKDEQEAAVEAEKVATRRAAELARQAIEDAKRQAESDRVQAEADERYRRLREEHIQKAETRPMALTPDFAETKPFMADPVSDAGTPPTAQTSGSVGKVTIVASVLVVGVLFVVLLGLQPGGPKPAGLAAPAPAASTPVAVATAPPAAIPASPASAVVAESKPAAAPAPAKPPKEDSTKSAEAQQYQQTLKRVEAEHPELNPRHVAHRPDLVAYVAYRMQVHIKAGYPKPKALEIAVRDLETLDATRQAIEKQKAQREKAPVPDVPPVLDKGGHTGFDPKCRWISTQEWSCK
jgi:curved DNA-binding protein CbpA